MTFEGKTAFVTGAAGGIGRAIALIFAKCGANVVLVDLSDAGEAVADEVRALGREALFVQASVADEAQVATAVTAAVETFGQIDVCANNAGIEGLSAPIMDYDAAEWDKVMAVNVRSVFLCLKHQIRHMVSAGVKGAIVNTSSIAGLRGGHSVAAYATSKHAINGLTKSAALEGAEHGIRVNAVAPGTVDTGMAERMLADLPEDTDEATKALISGVSSTPLGRLGQPEEMAEAIVWLCSEQASFVTGSIMSTDGGWNAG